MGASSFELSGTFIVSLIILMFLRSQNAPEAPEQRQRQTIRLKRFKPPTFFKALVTCYSVAGGPTSREQASS